MTKLQQAVKEQLGCESEEDFIQTLKGVQRGGADAGFAGFCYYTDTCAFYEENEEAIWDALVDDCDQCGAENPIEFVGSFVRAKDVSTSDQFKNLLAWYALERVAGELGE